MMHVSKQFSELLFSFEARKALHEQINFAVIAQSVEYLLITHVQTSGILYMV